MNKDIQGNLCVGDPSEARVRQSNTMMRDPQETVSEVNNGVSTGLPNQTRRSTNLPPEDPEGPDHFSNRSTSVDQILSQRQLAYAESQRYKMLALRLDHIEKLIKKNQKEHELFCKELPDRVGKVVGLYVVGDSWFRWDSTHSYYPTLCFKFKEVNCEKYARTSQIKVKLKENNQDLTDADIRRLRNSVEQLGDLTYLYGTNRGYFIAKDRRFKTTVYGDSRENVEHVLRACLSVVEEEFDPNDLSYTDGNHRVNVVKRKQPLSNVGENPVDYKSASKQQLFRVLLMVNGLSHPIVIKE